MSQDGQTHSNRVKFIYNAQFPAATAVVLDYLLNNPHFTGRQGRQQGMDAIMASIPWRRSFTVSYRSRRFRKWRGTVWSGW
jgi:hypothetical protein